MSQLQEAARGNARRSRYGGVGLALRSRASVRGASVLVGGLVFVLAALIVAGPSLFAGLTSSELAHTADQVPPKDRYLTARSASQPVQDSSIRNDNGAAHGLTEVQDQVYGRFLDQIEELHDQLPEPLRSLVGPAQWSISTPALKYPLPELRTDPQGSGVVLQAVMDIHAADVADLVAGNWPEPIFASIDDPTDLVVSEQTAQHLGLSVGQVFTPYRIAGIFRPKDPDADYWALHPGMVNPDIFDDGNLPPKITATVFMDPINTAPFDPSRDLTQIWYPIDLAAMDGSQAGLVLSQMRGAVAKTHDLPTAAEPDQPAGSIQSLTLTAGIVPSLEQALDRISSARSVLLVAAIGPLGAVIAVVALGLGAFAERRRPTVAALATRGGSRGQVRGLLAADGLPIGLVPALVAVGLAWWLFGPDLSVTGAVVAGVAGLIPAAFLAATPIAATVRRTRPDAGIRTRHRYRWVAELSVLALAGVSVYLLFSAGLQTQSTGVGLDVLVAAAPLLLAAAACVVVFRFYPLPLRVLSGHYRRGRSAVGFLGSLRALRDPAVGVAPVLAVVVGVSVAVFSAVTLTTLDNGIRTAAVSAVGADLRVDSLVVSDANLAAVAKLPGVAAAARFQLVGSESVTIPGRPAPLTVDVYLADTAALAKVQADVAGAVVIPPGMADAAPPAVVVSSDIAAEVAGPNGAFEPGASIDVDGADVRVLATSDHLPGLGQSQTWLLGDATAGTPSKLGTFRPTAMLVSLKPGTDPLVVTNEIITVLGTVISASTPAEAVAVATADPIVSGLRVALIAALAVAALAAAGAVLLTVLLGTATRIRMLALLRVLGMSVRQRRLIVVWEQAPTVVASVLVGAGLGAALTAVVRSVVDLRPFTAGVLQPDLSVGTGLLFVLLGGFVVMVALAIAMGLLLTRRTGVAAVVRMDEE